MERMYEFFVGLVVFCLWGAMRYRARRFHYPWTETIWIDFFGIFLLIYVIFSFADFHFPPAYPPFDIFWHVLEAVVILLLVIKVLPRRLMPLGILLWVLEYGLYWTTVDFWHRFPGSVAGFLEKHLYEVRGIVTFLMALLVIPFAWPYMRDSRRHLKNAVTKLAGKSE